MVKNISKTKKKMSDFYYNGLSLKNEDNSFFEVAPLISTNLGYFPITGVYRSENEKLTTIKTKDYVLEVAKDDHTFLQYSEGNQPEWKNLNDLQLGDKIITLSGAQEIVEVSDSGDGNIFDFRVDPTHAYFTNGILSHNSMIALSMMRDEDIDLIVYMDSEGGGVTEDFAKFLGIDPSKILYTPIDTVEDLINRMRKVIDIIEKNNSAKSVLMVIDSISMLSTEKEKDPNAGEDMGRRAKVSRSFFRQNVRKMQKLNICAVATAHLTSNIGGYGPSQIVSGGSILGYVPSVEVRFSRVNKDSEVEKSAKGSQMIKTRAEIVKSRFGTYGKRVMFDLDMKYGLDPYAGLVDVLRDYEFVIPAAADLEKQIEDKNVPKRSTGWWAFKPWDNRSKDLFEYMKSSGLASSGKFREKDFGKFLSEDKEFFDSVAHLLTIIEGDEIVETTEETISTAKESTPKTSSTEKTTKTKSKKTAGVSMSEKDESSGPEAKGSDVKVTEIS